MGCLLDQRAQVGSRDAQCAAGESLNVRGIDTDDLTADIQDRPAAAAAGGGRVIDKLVGGDIANMSKGGGWPYERERRQFAGCAGVVLVRRQALVDRGRRLGDHASDSHGICKQDRKSTRLNSSHMSIS